MAGEWGRSTTAATVCSRSTSSTLTAWHRTSRSGSTRDGSPTRRGSTIRRCWSPNRDKIAPTPSSITAAGRVRGDPAVTALQAELPVLRPPVLRGQRHRGNSDTLPGRVASPTRRPKAARCYRWRRAPVAADAGVTAPAAVVQRRVGLASTPGSPTSCDSVGPVLAITLARQRAAEFTSWQNSVVLSGSVSLHSTL